MRIMLIVAVGALAGGFFYLGLGPRPASGTGTGAGAPAAPTVKFSGDLAGIENSPTLVLMALETRRNDKVENFHGYPIIGTTTAAKPDEKTALLTALKRSIDESDGSAAMCFNPRHGLRATVGSKTVDLVICFECYQIYVYPDSTDEKKYSDVLIAPTARTTFENMLVKAGAIPASRIKEEPGGAETKGGK